MPYSHPPWELLFLGAHPPGPLPEGDSPYGLPHDDFEIVTELDFVAALRQALRRGGVRRYSYSRVGQGER